MPPELYHCEKFCKRSRLIATDIWKTCDKVRAAVLRGGFDLWSWFRPFDPNNCCLISEAQFVSVLAGPMRESLGLTSNELSQLTDYFRVHDGRIFYTQFCDIIHSNLPNECRNPPLCTGLEWTHPCVATNLTQIEEWKVSLLLTKIATLVNRRHLILKPYFQDYELISKNAGLITKNHFARVLTHLNIKVSADEYQLLVKKFGRDSYTLDYVAFLASLDRIICTLREQGDIDVGGDLLTQFPGRALCAPLPALPRPELTNVCKKSPRPTELCDALRRFMCFIVKHQICADDFFKLYDRLGCGRVTEAQFRRCLDKIGACAPQRFMFTKEEVDRIVTAYRAPNDPDRVCYCLFEEDMEHALNPQERMYCSMQNQTLPLKAYREPESLPPRQAAEEEVVDCESVIRGIKRRVCERQLHMKPTFHMYDPKNTGHVSGAQMRHTFMALGILFTRYELDVLETRFCDEMGFNYRWFLSEVEPADVGGIPTDKYIQEKVMRDPRPYPYPGPTVAERDIVEIMAKMKRKIVRDDICLMPVLQVKDPEDEGHMSCENFGAALGELGFTLTPVEAETLLDAFGQTGHPERVDYKRFVDAIMAAVRQPCLERAPLIAPIEQIPRADNCRNFLNFEDRLRAGRAMQKLAEQPYMELEKYFRAHDHCRVGLVSPQQFRCVMHEHGLYHLMSTPEVEAVVRCFGVRRGAQDDIDYRAFCHALNILQVNRRRRVI